MAIVRWKKTGRTYKPKASVWKRGQIGLNNDALKEFGIIKNEKNEILLEIPATIGVIGIVIAPWLAALGTIAAIATKCKIVVEKRE